MNHQPIPDDAVHYGGMWQARPHTAGAGVTDPAVRAILFKQLAERGLPPIHLPKLHAPSGFCVHSPRFGFSDAPVRAIVLRYEHHERLIAEERSQVSGEAAIDAATDITTTAAEYVQ